MPLRGFLFKKIRASRKEREQIEKNQLSDHFRKGGEEIAKIRKKRVEAQGKQKLQSLLAEEKRMLKAAKSPSRVSRFEGFLGKRAKGGITAAKFEALKQIKKKLKKPKKRRTRRKKRTTKRRIRRKKRS